MQGRQDFAEFMQASTNRLFRTAYLLTGDRHRAEDLTQDAFTRTYSAWSRVRNEDAYAYTRRVLINLHNDWWRARRWREQGVREAPPTEDHAPGIVRRDSIVRALRSLTRRERSVVVLRYFADLTEVDTARELGISLGTVKSTNARAMGKLREAMQDETRDLTMEMSLATVRGKARRRTALQTGLACALILTAAVAWWPSQPLSEPTASAPAVGVQTERPVRTGVKLKDGRELVLLGVSSAGGRDDSGTITPVLATLSNSLLDRVAEPAPFAGEPYYVEGQNNTYILFGVIDRPVSRISATSGTETDTAKWTETHYLYWVTGLKPEAGFSNPYRALHITAFDESGKELGTAQF